MPRISWATEAERAFLDSLMPEYRACQEKRRYKGFWQRVNAEFPAMFPMLDKLFPGLKITDLNREQREMLKGALVKQLQRLKEWYRWKCNPRRRRSTAARLTSARGVLPRKVVSCNCSNNGRDEADEPFDAWVIYDPELVDGDAASQRDEVSGVPWALTP